MTRRKPDVDVSDVWWMDSNGPTVYDFPTLFGNENPVELDVGCGKGLFLFNQSQLRPDVNFVGIDWSATYSRMAAARIVRHSIDTVRVICGDAWRILPRFQDQSLQAIHVYFPDPWWKRRHRKRRLISPPFFDEVARLVRNGGRLCLATDVQEYFGVMRELAEGSGFLRRLADPEPTSEKSDLDYLTHFERKYRRIGKEVFRSQYMMIR